MQDLKVAIIQSKLAWEQPAENRRHFSDKIADISEEVDLIVLPEMFTTGFSMSPENCAEGMNGETCQWMQEIAREKNSAICGSIMIVENGKYFNRFLFVAPNGDISTYNKRHLFTLAGEHETYEQGKQNVLIEYKGWKIRPQICYDLRFPVFIRNTDNYDLLIFVANWPETRINAWDTLLKARAIENLCYAIGVNRVGDDANNLKYNGHSAIYNPLGNEICSPIHVEEKTVVVTLEKSVIDKTRNQLNFLNDRDQFKIDL